MLKKLSLAAVGSLIIALGMGETALGAQFISSVVITIVSNFYLVRVIKQR